MNAVIIGHGPSLDGKKRGAEIDRFDNIIRLGNFFWQEIEHYGSRTDYILLPVSQIRYTGNTPVKSQPKPVANTHVPPVAAKELWLTHNGGNLDGVPVGLESDLLIRNLRDFKPVVFSEIIFYWLYRFSKLNPEFMKFAKGILAVIIAASHLKPDLLCLAGCDNLQKGAAGNYGLPHREGTSSGHDIKAESQLVNEVADTYGVRIEYI